MKLCKETKFTVREGDFLYDGNDHFVLRVMGTRGAANRQDGLYITTELPDGRRVYSGRASDYYGMEIVNADSPEELYESAVSLWTDLGGKI